MKILMTLVLALSMCGLTKADAVCVPVEPVCTQYTQVYWYPGKHARPAIRGLARGGARLLRGAARGTGRALRGAARAVTPNVFEVTVVTTDGDVVFYAIAGSKTGLNARLRANSSTGFLLYRTPEGLRRIASATIESVTVRQLN